MRAIMAKHLTEERIALTTSTEQLARVDAWRRLQPDLPPRAEAIRRLVEQALAATQPKPDQTEA